MHSVWIWIDAGPCLVSLHLIKRISLLHVNYLHYLNMYHQTNMSALKQIHKCTWKHTGAPEHEARSHTPVHRADNERTLLCSVGWEAQAPLCPVPDAFLVLPLQKTRLSSEWFECRLCSAPRECQHPAGALLLSGASANLRYVKLLVWEIVIPLSSAQVRSKGSTGELHLN